MHEKCEEKIKLGIETLKSFFDSLGPNDIYKQILLEELFKELMKNDIPLSDTEKQQGL